MAQQEIEAKVIEIYTLLEETFKGKDNKKIKEAIAKLNAIFSDVKNSINYLFIALSTKEISGKEISLDLHKSVSLFLQKIIASQNVLQEEEILFCLNQIFDLILNKSKNNPHLNDNSIMKIFQSTIKELLSSLVLLSNQDYNKQLFYILLTTLKNETNEFYLKTAKSVIILTSTLLTSGKANTNNYEQLINDYYIPIINNIFLNVPNYLDPKNNIYNIEFIIILKILLEGFFQNLVKIKSSYPKDKIKEIAMKFFREYGNYCFELIQLMPQFDEETKNKYGSPNPIIVFNKDENICKEINNMKNRAIQFLSLIIQITSLKEKNSIEDDSNYINDKDLEKMVTDIIALILNTFQDILISKEKFNLIRRYSGEENDEEDCYKSLLYQICVFLSRSLIREPIKTSFSPNMRQFLLNKLFPLIVTIDDEKIFLETDPDGYHQYISNITFLFKEKSFRTSACFLIKKICDEYEEMGNFVLSFGFEMFNYIIKRGENIGDLSGYNVYLKHKNNALIDQFNDKIKLDFCLLIILILKEKIIQNNYLKKRLLNILIENYTNIHLIPFSIIRIKLCKIYYYFLPLYFGNVPFSEENKKIFLENVVNYLLNCIIQKNINIDEEYCQALSYEATSTIIKLMSIHKDIKENNITSLKDYISENLEKNFEIFVQLIPNIDIFVYFLLLEQIIKNIKITQRHLIFDCLNSLSKKFLLLYVGQNNDKNHLFFPQYFTIINSLLTGKNKIEPENNEEISKFNEYFDQILNYIKNPKKFIYCEPLISNVQQCIKSFDRINDRSILVLKSIKIIQENDSTTNLTCYNYVSTFLSYMQKNKSEKPLNESEIFNDILEIIKKSFAFKDETLKTSINYALLLTLQLFDINPNLNQEIFEFLIIESFNCFEFSQGENSIFSFFENINQLSLANVSMGLIFKPEQTFVLLNKKITISLNGEQKEITRIEKYVNMIHEIMRISQPPYYYPNLGKCIILGICSIFSNKTIQEFLDNSKEFKFFLLITFIKFALFHKQQKCIILENLMKKEIKCNFVEEEENEEEEEEESDDDEFNSNIDQALSCSNNFKLSDEFEFFSKVMKNIKENDKAIYDFLSVKSKNAIIVAEELAQMRNINIKYNEKEYTVPRKTVRIIRKPK